MAVARNIRDGALVSGVDRPREPCVGPGTFPEVPSLPPHGCMTLRKSSLSDFLIFILVKMRSVKLPALLSFRDFVRIK